MIERHWAEKRNAISAFAPSQVFADRQVIRWGLAGDESRRLLGKVSIRSLVIPLLMVRREAGLTSTAVPVDIFTGTDHESSKKTSRKNQAVAQFHGFPRIHHSR
jgi:hypothetical protein